MLFFNDTYFSTSFHSSSDQIQSEQTRSSSENLPFSISRLLSKPFDDGNKLDKDTENSKFGSLQNNGFHYTASALYSYPLYQPGQVLRVPPQRGPCTPLAWALPSMHPAALAHQAVKDRLAGKRQHQIKHRFCPQGQTGRHCRSSLVSLLRIHKTLKLTARIIVGLVMFIVR
jgi:hypothetical protein